MVNLKQEIISPVNIGQNAAELIDLMVLRSQSKTVEEVADGLLHHIFDLRMDVISWLANNGKDINIYLNELEKHIAVNLQSAPYSTLADTISEVLAVYHDIASNLLGSIPKEDADKAIRDNFQAPLRGHWAARTAQGRLAGVVVPKNYSQTPPDLPH